MALRRVDVDIVGSTFEGELLVMRLIARNFVPRKGLNDVTHGLERTVQTDCDRHRVDELSGNILRLIHRDGACTGARAGARPTGKPRARRYRRERDLGIW